MATHHGIDWEKVERRVGELQWMQAFVEGFKEARIVFVRGEPRLTLPTNIYLTPWQWAKGRRTASCMDALEYALERV